MLKRKQLWIIAALVAGALALEAVPALAATATVTPRSGHVRTTFQIKLTGFKAGERVRAIHSERYAGVLQKFRFRVNAQGVKILFVKGQLKGQHTWRFRGLSSNRFAKVSYRVR